LLRLSDLIVSPLSASTLQKAAINSTASEPR